MIVVSHRGPERFEQAGDGFRRTRGAGGVVSALRPLLAGTETTWVAAAIGDDDRAAVAAGAAVSPDFDLRLLALDPTAHHLHYDLISNSLLWFLHHGLFDLPRRPVIDRRFNEAWDGYRAVNEAYANEVATIAPASETVIVHDYHLALVPGMLATARPDLRIAFFQHTPHCGPTSVRVLPERAAAEMLGSMGSAPAGFHVARWANAYAACHREVLRSDTLPPTYAAPLGIDAAALDESAASEEARVEAERIAALVGDRRVILRVDRIEPSKNQVRGFRAYDLLLEEHPEWRERVAFLALVYPSREGLAEYLAYAQEVEQAAAAVNDRWATRDWQPVVVDAEDTYPRSIAGLSAFDVLLVNPLKDGLNLVAKEGAYLNGRDGVLALSHEAGAYDELGEAALAVHPFDIGQTADVLHAALAMDASERAGRAARLRALATARTSQHWLDDMISQARH